MTTYTGDILIVQTKEGDFDIEFLNGQPVMTDSFDTSIMYAVFGDSDTWQNLIAKNENEKMKSEFYKTISRATVSDETRNNGTESLKSALKYLIDIGASSKINVTGEIVSVFAIVWNIEIFRPNDVTIKYFINWEKGIIELTRG